MTLPVLHRRAYTLDALTELKDSYAETADAAGQVDSSAKILNVGDGRYDAMAVIEVSSIAIDGNDERYDIIIQGSTSSTFASTIKNLAILSLGATEVALGGADDGAAGSYELPFSNAFDETVYPYIRTYCEHTGSTTSITHTVRVGKMAGYS